MIRFFSSDVLEEIRSDIHTLSNFEEPYLKDDLYDRSTDRIIEWSFAHNGPIKIEQDRKQYR